MEEDEVAFEAAEVAAAEAHRRAWEVDPDLIGTDNGLLTIIVSNLRSRLWTRFWVATTDIP